MRQKLVINHAQGCIFFVLCDNFFDRAGQQSEK